MLQVRLTNISLLNIERNRTNDLDINKIINVFANDKARKRVFLNNFFAVQTCFYLCYFL
jgi:hypothetical protein